MTIFCNKLYQFVTEYNHFGAEITLKQQIEINYLKDLLDASGAMVKKSISALSYVMKNYKDKFIFFFSFLG